MQDSNQGLMADYLSAKQAALELQVSQFTLRRWRKQTYGPLPVKVGGRLRYRRSDIRSWLTSLGSHARASG